MRGLLLDFYDNIGKKIQFWLPVLIIAFSAFGFSIFNRTINWDDLLRQHYFDQTLLGRWGMNVWSLVVGTLSIVPYTDRFLSFLLLLSSSFFLSSLFYYISGHKRIWSYTVFASIFVSYPLINEIWEYIGADVMVTGNKCLVTIAFIILLVNEKKVNRANYVVSIFLMVIPVSSYESPVFMYVSILCFYMFYGYSFLNSSFVPIKKWFYLSIYYLLPILIAYIIRLFVCRILCFLIGCSPQDIGDTSITWGTNSFVFILKGLVKDWIYDYVVNGFVYFPIFVFVLFSLLFMSYVVYFTIMKKNIQLLLFGVFAFISLFSLMCIQGSLQPYRTSQSLSFFVAFVAFMLCVHIKKRNMYNAVVVVLLVLSWHQSVYMNKVLSLNNLRSNNEASVIRNMGLRILSGYEKKPVVFVSDIALGSWVEGEIRVDESSWNGKLYYAVASKISDLITSGDNNKYIWPHNKRYVHSNINNNFGYYPTIKDYFSYYGFDLDVICPKGRPNQKTNYNKHDKELLKKSISYAKKYKMKPFEIRDMGNYLIVNMNGSFYDVSRF